MSPQGSICCFSELYFHPAYALAFIWNFLKLFQPHWLSCRKCFSFSFSRWKSNFRDSHCNLQRQGVQLVIYWVHTCSRKVDTFMKKGLPVVHFWPHNLCQVESLFGLFCVFATLPFLAYPLVKFSQVVLKVLPVMTQFAEGHQRKTWKVTNKIKQWAMLVQLQSWMEINCGTPPYMNECATLLTLYAKEKHRNRCSDWK